jgi:hypothetical protein
MKKLVKVFALAVMMVMCGQAMAQTRGAMFLGASFPLEDYADFDEFDDFALVSNYLDDDDAGAGIGFNAGLKWYFNVGVKGLDVMLSLDGFFNGPNADLKTAYRNNEGSIGGQIIGAGFEYKSTPKYINVPAMLGLNYMYHLNPNFGIFVEAGAGGNLRFITDMEYVTKTHVWIFDTNTKVTNNYDKAFTFAYQVGLGVEVAKNLVIGCSFYDLGKAQVIGERVVRGDSNSPYAENWGTMHPMMILGRVGFSF